MFILGTQYYRYPTPIEDDWRTDLRRIRRHGMTAVKFWLNWAHVQPTPDGFTFDTFDRLMDECQQAGCPGQRQSTRRGGAGYIPCLPVGQRAGGDLRVGRCVAARQSALLSPAHATGQRSG